MFAIARSGMLLALALLACAGCSGQTNPAASRFDATASSLVGRWRAVPRDASEGASGQDMKGALGETIRFRWEFQDDHTCRMESEVSPGLVPAPGASSRVSTTWKVREIHGNTVLIEIANSTGVPPAPVKVVFQSNDQCTFDSGDEAGALVLTRLP